MSSISKKARREILVAVSERYRMAEKRDKSRVLSEFVALTKYHPKLTVRLLEHLRDFDDLARVGCVTPALCPRGVGPGTSHS